MVRLILAGLFLLTFLFLGTAFQTSQAARARAESFFTAEQIDTGLEYGFERRLLSWTGIFVHFGFLAVLVGTSLARRVTDRCQALVRGWWLPTVLLVGALYFLAETVVTLPFSIAGLFHSRAWGMTQRGLDDWLVDYAKGLGVAAVRDGLILTGLYVLLRWQPRRWWLPAAIAGTLFAVVYAFLLPVVIAPIFNTFTPLSQTRWASLEPEVRQLAYKAEVPVGEILVVDASRQSNHTNAYFTGFGATRRIVLYDTLLKEHPAEEVISILGHELGHWQHNHIVKGLTLLGLGSVVGFFLLSRILLWAVGRGSLSLHAPADPAGLPLILLLITLGFWLAAPVENSISRHFERQADTAALELAGRPEVFKNAEIRLAVKNKSDVAPPPMRVWLFASHPPAVERILMAEDWLLNHPQK